MEDKRFTETISLYLKAIFRPKKKIPLKKIPLFFQQLAAFQKRGGNVRQLFPILSESNDQAGSASGHYFHQDLLIATAIHNEKPERHIDVGSRIDGFVAHVASFRKIDVMDVRPLKNPGHKNIRYIQANLMDPKSVEHINADSISCLHAIEHFGLGRYGDPLDPEGHLKGFQNLLRMLSPGGKLYISFPISNSDDGVFFNAHRIFNPLSILNWDTNNQTINLARFDYVDDLGDVHQDINLFEYPINCEYGCGIYTFHKV